MNMIPNALCSLLDSKHSFSHESLYPEYSPPPPPPLATGPFWRVELEYQSLKMGTVINKYQQQKIPRLCLLCFVEPEWNSGSHTSIASAQLQGISLTLITDFDWGITPLCMQGLLLGWCFLVGAASVLEDTLAQP